MAAPPSRRDLLIAALASVLIGCPPAAGPADAGADAGADALDATSRDGGAPPSPPLDAGPEACPAGALRYTDAGACLPADPCRGDTSCAGAERICLGVDGVARCGRCLDGFAERDGACVEDPRLRERATRFRVGTDYFWVWSGTRYERLYVRGVNLGGSVPGTGPRGGAIGRARYDRWLAMMSEAGLDAVRVYSLHPPELYEALAAHNRARPDRPIYLLQGVWLTDPVDDEDLYALTEGFDEAVRGTLEALHGARAPYVTDVSEWVLGWLIGREVLATEVRRTDARHPDVTAYEGRAFRVEGATATEAWITERLDRTVIFEAARWGESRPVAFSSWMELDPLSHPTEPSWTNTATTRVDLSRVENVGAPAGHFISYHVYPYYPRFVSEDPRYRAHADEHGPNAYRGLLLRLRDHYRDLPVLVAEYGVPSSWGRAHPSYSGMHHGGLTEREQGDALARMTRDIREARYAGGVAFKWQDGWWKPTWITNQRTFPASRYALWHDLSTPQQSYGLLAFDPPPPAWEVLVDDPDGAGPVARVEMSADALALRVRIGLRAARELPAMVVGLDTYRDDLGDSRLPDGTATSIRSELALEIEPASERARLRVIEPYDTFAIREVPARRTFASIARDGGEWVPILWQMTVDHGSDDGAYFFPSERFELGALRILRPGERPTRQDAVIYDGRTVELVLPWVHLSFADPSTRTVVHDAPETAAIEGERSEGVRIAIAIDGALVETRRFAWPTWDEAPPTTERLKDGAAAFFAALADP